MKAYDLLSVQDQITHIEADSNYSWAYLHDGRKLLYCYPLSWWVNMLDLTGWFRIHRSHLINLKFLEGVQEPGYALINVLHAGRVLPVPRRKQPQFLTTIKNGFQAIGPDA